MGTGRAPHPFPSKIPIHSMPEEVNHATRLQRRRELLLKSCPSGVEATLSETHVKRGRRVVHSDKELHEKMGRNDPCPCGSGRLFKRCCRNSGLFSTALRGTITSDRVLTSGGSGVKPCVRRGKVLNLQWVQFPPGNWVAPAGSYRSGGGGNKTVGAFERYVRHIICVCR